VLSFFGMRGFPYSRLGGTPFPSCLGAAQVSGALALVGTNYYDLNLGSESIFWPPGAIPGILASRVGGGAGIPLLCAAQVSNLLDILDIHSTDIYQED